MPDASLNITADFGNKDIISFPYQYSSNLFWQLSYFKQIILRNGSTETHDAM